MTQPIPHKSHLEITECKDTQAKESLYEAGAIVGRHVREVAFTWIWIRGVTSDGCTVA